MVDAGHWLRDGAPTADAESSASPTCSSWEVQVIEANAYNRVVDTQGWEPIGLNLTNTSTGNTELHLRRRVQ